MANKYKWIPIKNQGYVTGFYYEKPIAGPEIMRLGVIGDSNSKSITHLNLQYPVCHHPYLPSVGPNTGLFLSVAILSSLQRVELCRVANRCTRVMIHYLKGLPVVLRQWHTSCPLQRTCIYDSHRPNIASKIYFRTLKSRDH